MNTLTSATNGTSNFSDKFIPTNEVMFAFTSYVLSDEDRDALCANPKAFAFDRANLRIDDEVNLAVVKNTEDTMHLTLPYYDQISRSSAMAIGDDELEAVAGGEILITLLVTGLGIAGAVAGGLSTVAIGVGVGSAIAVSVAGGVIVGEAIERKLREQENRPQKAK